MKRSFELFYIIVFSLNLFACKNKFNEILNVQNNTVFTDEFFEDIVEIDDARYGSVSGRQMEPIIKYLKSLYLSETDIDLDSNREEGILGFDAIYFIKEDGTRIDIYRNHVVFNKINGVSYIISNGNLNIGLEIAFDFGSSREK